MLPVCSKLRFACLAALAPTWGLAQPASELPLWEVGAGAVGVSQLAYPGSDQHVQRALAVPWVIYRGKFLRADRDTAGLRAIKNDQYELDLGVAFSFGSSSNAIEARRGMPNLGTLVEFGPRLRWNLLGGDGSGMRLRLDLPLRGVFDLSRSGSLRGTSFEPGLTFQRRSSGGWAYSASASAIVADQRLAQTFYGVDAAYALPDRPAYQAQSGLVAWRLSTAVTRSLAPDWRLWAFARLDSLAGAANEASPLVRRSTGSSVGLGVTYTWLRSEERAVD